MKIITGTTQIKGLINSLTAEKHGRFVHQKMTSEELTKYINDWFMCGE